MQVLTHKDTVVGIYIQGYIKRPCHQSGDVRITEHLFGVNTDGPFMLVGVGIDTIPATEYIHIANVFCSSYISIIDECGKAEDKCSALLLFAKRPPLEPFNTYGPLHNVSRQTLATYNAFLLSHKDHAFMKSSEFASLIPNADVDIGSPYKRVLDFMLAEASSASASDKKTISRLIISLCQQAVHDGEMEMSEVCDAIMKL